MLAITQYMSVHAVLNRLLQSDGPTVVVECRRCGTKVGSETETCPECGAAEISHYEIPS